MNYYENFLDQDDADDIYRILTAKNDWKDFYRNTSHMKESYDEPEEIFKIRQKLHSKQFIEWIQNEIHADGLVVDSYGIGEGVSLMKNGDKINSHIDFNWNDRIKMYRSVNLMIYFGNCEGGQFHVWDEDRKNIIFEKEPKHNSAIIFKHSEKNSHGVKEVLKGSRYALRQFYYTSDKECENPHQSLYWYNPQKNMKTNSNV